MNKTENALIEGLNQKEKVLEICHYARRLSEPVFNALVSTMLYAYASEHEDYNVLESVASIATSTYVGLGRDPHNDDTTK